MRINSKLKRRAVCTLSMKIKRAFCFTLICRDVLENAEGNSDYYDKLNAAYHRALSN